MQTDTNLNWQNNSCVLPIEQLLRAWKYTHFKTLFKYFEKDIVIISVKIVTLCAHIIHVLSVAVTEYLIKPFIKKPQLDPSNLANYRPILILPFMSKLLERGVSAQILYVL